MIIKFIEFLTEYKSYTGPFASTGFKTSEPTEKYTMSLDVEYDDDNENIIKNLLTKYNISYDDLKIQKEDNIFRRSGKQKIQLKFLSYSGLEAQSIIVSILRGLEKSNVPFDNETININPQPEVIKSNRKPIGFNR